MCACVCVCVCVLCVRCLCALLVYDSGGFVAPPPCRGPFPYYHTFTIDIDPLDSAASTFKYCYRYGLVCCCVAVCCSGLQCVALECSGMQCDAVCMSSTCIVYRPATYTHAHMYIYLYVCREREREI